MSKSDRKLVPDVETWVISGAAEYQVYLSAPKIAKSHDCCCLPNRCGWWLDPVSARYHMEQVYADLLCMVSKMMTRLACFWIVMALS
jgi:hypothetical protein